MKKETPTIDPKTLKKIQAAAKKLDASAKKCDKLFKQGDKAFDNLVKELKKKKFDLKGF